MNRLVKRPSLATPIILHGIKPDRLLFDEARFLQALGHTDDRLALFKQVLETGEDYLAGLYELGTDVQKLMAQRAWLIDQLLRHVLQLFVPLDRLALVAVGGYGRGELHPHSDIDLMILHEEAIDPGLLYQGIPAFLAFLWDIGLKVGHSVRTITDCKHRVEMDITIATNLLESRLICGNQRLFKKMQVITASKRIWSSRRFFETKLREQRERHDKFADTPYNVEPNIKESPGGLRDIQMIAWVLKRHFGVHRLRSLISNHFLISEEYQTLSKGRHLLWQIRYILHSLSGRCEDRLLFDYQRHVALQFGFSGKGNTGVEAFMKLYYTTVREISRLNEMLLQHFQEIILFARRKEKITPINRSFQIRNHFIEAVNKRIFTRDPFALLEIFLLIQQQGPKIKGVRASTIRLIRQHLGLIDDSFRQHPRAHQYFFEIIRQPRYVGHELRRMHRYGVLGAYLPVFARIQGLMQFDLLHSYTVDEHILFVVKNMRLFALDKYKAQHPLFFDVIKKIPKREILYIAGLFHDIAKGQKGDHSDLGAKEAENFCQLHQLSEYDTKLTVWLVKHHLLMSKVSQKQDINDPDVMRAFTRNVADQNHLNYLYLLTVADICATNPSLWNNWKAALLGDLYHNTLLLMRRGMEKPLHKRKRLQQIHQDTLSLIDQAQRDNKKIRSFWKTLKEDYFFRHSPREIAWHTAAVVHFDPDKLPLVQLYYEEEKGWTQILVYMKRTAGIFSATTRAIEKLCLTVLDARIITSKDGYTMDTYVVLEENGAPVSNKGRGREITTAIGNELKHCHQTKSLSRPIKLEDRKLKHFNIPTHIDFMSDHKNNRTIMEISTKDRPGVLSRIGIAMERCGAILLGARIATYGERVEDIFYITDKDNKIIENSQCYRCLKTCIIDLLA